MQIKKITIRTNSKTEFIDITSYVREIVSAAQITDGEVLIYCPHTTAAITINENADPAVKRDIIYMIRKLIPEKENYTHYEGNSSAHIASTLVGVSETVPIKDGSMMLGTWQGIYFCEFDGPRTRSFIVEVKG